VQDTLPRASRDDHPPRQRRPRARGKRRRTRSPDGDQGRHRLRLGGLDHLPSNEHPRHPPNIGGGVAAM